MSYKTLFSAIAIMAVVFFCQSCKKDKSNMVCIPTGLQPGVIAFYPFSNGSLNDFSGNNHNLVNTTGAHSAPDRSGNPNCAFQFNNLPASTQFLTTTGTSFLNGLNTFSISLWYEPMDSTESTIAYEVLVGRDTGLSCPDRSGQWAVGLYDCRKAVFGRLNSVWDGNITNFDCQQELYVRTGSWHHLVATFDGSNNNEMKIYRDGALQNTSSGSPTCSPAANFQDIGDLFIGKDYTGRLDDIIIYNIALNQSQVTQLFATPTCCAQ